MITDLLCNCFKIFENDEIKPKKTLEISDIQLNLAPESDITNHDNDDNTNYENTNQLDTITIIHGSKTISLPKLDITDYASLQYNKIINPPTIIPNNNLPNEIISNNNLPNNIIPNNIMPNNIIPNEIISNDNLSNNNLSNNIIPNNTNLNSKENDDNIDDDFVVL